MSDPLPYRDEPIKGGTKRVYWPRGDALDVKRELRHKAAGMTSKRGKPYGREDQRKIANEKYGEFCESHPQWPEH